MIRSIVGAFLVICLAGCIGRDVVQDAALTSLDGGRLEDAATAVWGDGRPGDCPVLTAGCHTPCSFQGTCYYGRECCCGECFPALGCRCSNGVTECFYLESCQAATCTGP